MALLSHQRQDGFDHVEHVEAVRLEQLVNSSSMIVENDMAKKVRFIRGSSSLVRTDPLLNLAAAAFTTSGNGAETS